MSSFLNQLVCFHTSLELRNNSIAEPLAVASGCYGQLNNIIGPQVQHYDARILGLQTVGRSIRSYRERFCN